MNKAQIVLGILGAVVIRHALAMTGECYQDRRPGGCYEVESAMEQQQKERAAEYDRFISLMGETPADKLPGFCAVAPGPGGGRNQPARELFTEEIKTCIGTAEAWWAARRDREAQQRADYMKAVRWQSLTAANGAVYKVDIAHIQRSELGAQISVYKDEGGDFNPLLMTTLLFNCQGRYHDFANMGAGSQYAPPLSVAGQIQRIACALKK